ncbi:lipid-A-disaccharide synthase [Campylobacter sp. 19-13652]|uniref:lipid-A-disaccharide synthase n=1 Tax=Campylobacter sp. 19-13652 TaxID=2840180 RepID=UPI001C749649|nr:lipid-A-disaccharide synthase [Campylobacter sp. 19-13652]BCX78805.1 lipid-A-disaccharide synthase [Campylobacter sp. 19-13652]
MKKILISALEPSANLHLGEVLKHLAGYEICGIFDERYGVPAYKSSEFSAMGFAGVLGLVFKARQAIKELVCLAKDCDVVLLIDAPAFNIPLAKALKNAGVKAKIIYYILPKVWAWKRERAKAVRQYCDELASILPFDEQFFVGAKYVGNPLLDEIKQFKSAPSKSGVVAFMPGSRRGEIARLMPVFKQVAGQIAAKKVLVVPPFFRDRLSEIYGDVSEFEISSDTASTLNLSDFAFICSGTATLEAALIGTPFVLAYKARAVDIMIAKMLVKIKFIGLANIMFDFMGKPPLNVELIQDDVSAKSLLNAYENHDADKFITAASELRDYLGQGSSQNVANLIKEIAVE